MNLRRRTFTVILAVAAVTGTAVPAASAAPGDLDPTFAGGGELRINGATYDIESLAGGGFALATGGTRATVAVYDRDGRRDAAFGGQGRTIIPGPDWTLTDIERAVDIERHLAGWIAVLEEGHWTEPTPWLTRLTSDGTIDTRFGRDGYVRVARAPARVDSVGVDSENRILAVVIVQGRRGKDDVATLRRYLPDGTPDPTYGGDGVVRVTTARSIRVSEITVTPSDDVVLEVERFDGSTSTSELHQFSRDGARSRDLGARGRLLVTVPGYAATWVAGVHRLRDGKLVVTGTAVRQDERQHLFAMRLTPTGQVDPTYGNAGVGIVSDPVWSLQQGSATVDRQGRVYLSGITFNQNVVARLTTAGRLDTTFGGPASVRTSLPGWVQYWVVQSDALVLGTYYRFSSPNMRIVRMET